MKNTCFVNQLQEDILTTRTACVCACAFVSHFMSQVQKFSVNVRGTQHAVYKTLNVC